MTARAPLIDYDDSCPTLELQTPFACAPSSGVWPSQPGAPARAHVHASQDPANSTLLDAVVPGALSTWQNERLQSADASLAIRASSAAISPRQRTSTAPLARSLATPPARSAPGSRKISLGPSVSPSLNPNATMSPDGTLLPWRHERPPSRRGAVALALVFALVASAGATVGFLRSTNQPVAVAARVARTPASGVRQLNFEGSSESKHEAAPAPSSRTARRVARPAAARATSPAAAADVGADLIGE